ncbi:MAG TPA: hypothetical protein PLU30_14075 [Verrucomicrobiae bacterium]|nr:hypothetical protein [Verrucomicrobiae bacterium]
MTKFLVFIAVIVGLVMWIRRGLRRLVRRSASFQGRPGERSVRLVPFYDAENKKVIMIPEDELEPGMRKVRIPGLDTEAYVSQDDRARRNT